MAKITSKWERGLHKKAVTLTSKTGVPHFIVEDSEGNRSVHPLFSDKETLARYLCEILGGTFIDRTFVI